MAVEVKNPIVLILLTWITLLIGHLGIPLLPLEGTSVTQQSIISFLAMNFHVLGENTNLSIFLISWVISICLFGICIKFDWKMPLYCIVTEGLLYLFSIILLGKLEQYLSVSYKPIKVELAIGLGIVSGIILLLYFPILIRNQLMKRTQNSVTPFENNTYITKCPFCLTEYQSNPSICYKCSKNLDPLS